MPLLFKNYSFVEEVTDLLIKFRKTNHSHETQHYEGNSVNKQNTQVPSPHTERKITLKTVTMKISDTPLSF